MKSATINRFNTTMLLLFFMLGFCVTPTFADTGRTNWNLDSIFGHSESSEGIEDHDSEWPTEEQPRDFKKACKSSVVVEDIEEHDSEWPIEEQPVSVN